MRSPVLIIAFARPETTRAVFDAVRSAQPSRLYVAVDGPRPNRPGDVTATAVVRSIFDQIDWPCELKTWFRTDNYGCGRGPAAAIDWFFENEEEGIVLEDDCVPVPSFFPFCDELLERYRNDERVAQICGSSFVDRPETGASYYFTKYADIWGWATWRRSWILADLEMKDWPAWRNSGGLARLSGSTPGFVQMWTRIFDAMHAQGVIDIWDFQWMYSCWRHDLVSISPRYPLIRNVGFGSDATHHVEADVPSYVREPGEVTFPLTHPVSRELDPLLEQAVARNRYSVTRSTDLAARAARIPLVGTPIVEMAKQLRMVARKRSC